MPRPSWLLHLLSPSWTRNRSVLRLQPRSPIYLCRVHLLARRTIFSPTFDLERDQVHLFRSEDFYRAPKGHGPYLRFIRFFNNQYDNTHEFSGFIYLFIFDSIKRLDVIYSSDGFERSTIGLANIEAISHSPDHNLPHLTTSDYSIIMITPPLFLPIITISFCQTLLCAKMSVSASTATVECRLECEHFYSPLFSTYDWTYVLV